MFIYVKVYAKNEQIFNEILDYINIEIGIKGKVKLIDLYPRYRDKIVINDDDVFNYHEIGWNADSLGELVYAKRNLNSLELPSLRLLIH